MSGSARKSATSKGLRVLPARASGAEARLSFAALIDLLDGVGTDELAGLPALTCAHWGAVRPKKLVGHRELLLAADDVAVHPWP